MQENNTSNNSVFSLAILVHRFLAWISFLFSKTKIILIGTFVGLVLTLLANYIISPTYYARSRFVLDNAAGGGLGDISSLASLAGINASSFLEASSLFQLDNIQELYQSDQILRETLLAKTAFKGDTMLIIQRFMLADKLDKKWASEGVSISDFDALPYSRTQDSLVKELVEDIQKKYLLVNKPSRKTTILEVGFDHKDEALALTFNKELVKRVNEFYYETKTKKSGLNVAVLQRQSDSMKRVLDESLLILAEVDQRVANPNPLRKVSLVPYQKAMINTQANSAIYQEVLKQLEIAKITHRNKMPLIQMIDQPSYPLKNSRWKLLKTIVLGAFFGGFLTVLGLSAKRLFTSIMKQSTQV